MEYSPEFETFWKYYPHRNGKPVKKCPAYKMWNRLTEEDRHEILMKAKYIKRNEGGPYARDAVTWLHPENQRGWEDIEQQKGLKWEPALPVELTENALKDGRTIPINVNDERNEQKDKLGVR